MTPTMNVSATFPKRNESVSKWNLLFDKNVTEWISFKPQLGVHVYPCYACRDMFSSKTSFQDHINRRAVIIKYNCKDCVCENLFYNRCAFLLHCRSHFTLQEGYIDLTNVRIYTIPFGLAGFLPHPDIPRIYDEDEDIDPPDYYLNSQFYNPENTERGKDVIKLRPNDLIFYSRIGEETEQLALKQMSKKMPLCLFITVDEQNKLKKAAPMLSYRNNISNLTQAQIREATPNRTKERTHSIMEPLVHIKEEIDDNNETFVTRDELMTLPVIAKVESLVPSCQECSQPLNGMTLPEHFVGNNAPFDEKITCKQCNYTAMSKCSLLAHIRLHNLKPPYICPDCAVCYDKPQDLVKHLNEVCYHFAKQTRFRCPGKKCGKIFATTVTFAAHFILHILNLLQCRLCNHCFESPETFYAHCQVEHSSASDVINSTQVFKCSVCVEPNILYEKNLQQHVQFHITDRSRALYVYTCKQCRNYFRSTATFKQHVMRCPRAMQPKLPVPNQKKSQPFTLGQCRSCKGKLIYYENDVQVNCPKCKTANNLNENSKRSSTESPADEDYFCVLCNSELTVNEIKEHPKTCNYRMPKVVVNKLANDVISDKMSEVSVELQDTSFGSEVTETTSGRTSPKSDISDSVLSIKKRKKVMPSQRAKRTQVTPVVQPDPIAEDPKPFDGTYRCKLCYMKESDRGAFHMHIIQHRDVSTSYQCMDCGECFVVKPSLVKHLMHYHKIQDIDTYLSENDCFDVRAVQELREVMKLTPGEARGPIKANQCRVCLAEFNDVTELNTHFRVHGMAFLMKNTK